MADVDFEALVRTHERAVRAYARSMTASPTLADDAVQETFLKAWRYLDSFRGDGSFEGWLIRICRRCIIDLQTREQATLPAPLDECMSPASADRRSETMELVHALPLDQREVVVVCGILGYGYETAARMIDVPVGTIRSRLHRARAALAAALADTDTDTTEAQSRTA